MGWLLVRVIFPHFGAESLEIEAQFVGAPGSREAVCAVQVGIDLRCCQNEPIGACQAL